MQLQAALRDQETAVRGYVITGRRAVSRPVLRRPTRRKASGRKRPAASRHAAGSHRGPGRDRAGRGELADDLSQSRSSPTCAGGVPGAASRDLTDRGKSRIRPSPSTFRSPERESGGGAHRRNRRSSTRCGAGATAWPSPWWWRSSPWRSCWRCWSEARSPGRWPPWPRRAGASPRETSASASPHAGHGTFGPSRPTSRTCGSASWTNSRPPARPARSWTNRPRSYAGPTPNSSSSPMSPPTICRSRCGRSPRSASCSSGATATSSTSAVPNTSGSRSTAPNGCRR